MSFMGTRTTLPADQVSALTAELWQLGQEPLAADLMEAPVIRQIIDSSQHAGVAPQLRSLVERIDALVPADRRLFTASIDEVQVRSKLWLIDELTRGRDLHGTTLVVLGAWYGILPLLINLRVQRPPARMVCVDISAEAAGLGRRVIEPLFDNIEYQVADAMDLDYPAPEPSSVLVNTICEHLPDAPRWWARVPRGQLTVLQSNNYNLCRDHVNCVEDIEQMKAQTPMSELLYQGTLKLPIFDRFMLIGYR
jgi:hypothetical protein